MNEFQQDFRNSVNYHLWADLARLEELDFVAVLKYIFRATSIMTIAIW